MLFLGGRVGERGLALEEGWRKQTVTEPANSVLREGRQSLSALHSWALTPTPTPKSCPLFKTRARRDAGGGGSWSFTHGRGKSTLAEFEAMDFCLTKFSILIISTDSSKGAKGL